MISSCLFCAASHQPSSVRKVKGGQIARYKCCNVGWIMFWLTSALGEAAA